MAIITISRGTFSGGKILAECLGEALGYRLLSREELLATAAREYGALESELESALLNKPGFLERYRLTKLHYVSCVQAAMAAAVQADNVVYHGQAGHLLLRGIPHHLRVKVVADEEYRIRAAMARTNFSRERAIRYIRDLDAERDKWVQWVYGMDRNDPTSYDVVVNLERIPVEHVCETIVHMAQRDFQTTPASQQILDDLVLASGIRAKIAMDPNIADDVVEIEAKDGVITIRGTVRSLDDADRVRRLVHDLPGVRRIESEMGTRW